MTSKQRRSSKKKNKTYKRKQLTYKAGSSLPSPGTTSSERNYAKKVKAEENKIIKSIMERTQKWNSELARYVPATPVNSASQLVKMIKHK